MVAVYGSRRLAAINAMRRGIKAFECFMPMPHVDKKCWSYREHPVGPGVEYARIFAEGKDYIHHVEINEKLIPILVVSCLREEILEEIPELFKIEPLTPELWEAARREYPDVSPRRTPSLVSNPDRPLPLPSGIAQRPESFDSARIQSPEGTAQAPVANGPSPNAAGVTHSRSKGALSICREVFLAMRGSPKDAVIAAFLERGVYESTAKTQWYRLSAEFRGK